MWVCSPIFTKIDLHICGLDYIVSTLLKKKCSLKHRLKMLQPLLVSCFVLVAGSDECGLHCVLNEQPRFWYAIILNENFSEFSSTYTLRITHCSAKVDM